MDPKEKKGSQPTIENEVPICHRKMRICTSKKSKKGHQGKGNPTKGPPTFKLDRVKENRKKEKKE